MMFQADTAYAVELLALVAGTFLLVWVSRQEVCCKTFGKIVAYFTIVTSILAMLCTFYYTVRYWEDGHFRTPHGNVQMQEMGMMKGMMCKGKMGMMGGMGNKQGMGMGMMGGEMECPMMEKLMKECPMIKDCPMMQKMHENMPSEKTTGDEDHSAHH